VAPIRDSAIGLLSPELIPAPKSIPGQDSRDFTRNSKSTNYNDRNGIKGVNPNLTKNIYSY
jgi:hypothetical protein